MILQIPDSGRDEAVAAGLESPSGKPATRALIRRYLALLIAILVVAAALRIAWIVLVRSCPVSDFAAYDLAARGLARGLGYRIWGGKLTYFYAPGYPFTLSLLYRAFGDSWDAGKAANVGFDLATIALTCVMGALLFGRVVGLVAALILALWPSHWAYCGLLASEPEFTALLMGVLVLAVLASRRRLPSWRWVVLLGVLIGVTSLVRGAALLLALPIGVLWALCWPRQRWPVAARVGVMLGCTLLTIVPWTIRNYVVMGSPALICGDAGVSLWMGANPNATGTYYWPTAAVNPLDDIPFEQRGHEAQRLAMEFITSHPLSYIGLAVPKLRWLISDDTWGWRWASENLERPLPRFMLRSGSPDWVLRVFHGYYLVILFLSALGCVLAAWSSRSSPLAAFPLLVLAYWVIPHVIYIAVDRYHFPVTPMLALLAALAVATTFQRGSRLIRRAAAPQH